MIVKESESQRPEQIVDVVRLLLQSANESVKLSTALTTDLVNGVKPEMQAAIERVKSFQVWLDGSVDLDEKRKAFGWLLNNQKVEVFRAPTPIPHWIIVDNRDFRMEKPHASGAYPRRNMTIFDCKPTIAQGLLHQFREFCANSSPVPKG